MKITDISVERTNYAWETPRESNVGHLRGLKVQTVLKKERKCQRGDEAYSAKERKENDSN